LDEQELTGVAFYDVSIYITQLSAVKNFILAGDIGKGTFFFVFQEDPPKLVLLGKDHYPMRVFQSEFVIDGDQMGFAVMDDHKNLHIMGYDPFGKFLW
jgi:cleavage and polyadenylation specificity factor subunit 1